MTDDQERLREDLEEHKQRIAEFGMIVTVLMDRAGLKCFTFSQEEHEGAVKRLGKRLHVYFDGAGHGTVAFEPNLPGGRKQ